MLRERVAIIDFGSNSTRLMLIDVLHDGAFKVIDEIREPLRLADHLDTRRYFTPEIVYRTLDTSRAFSRFCQARRVSRTVAVATSAMREARNGADLARRITDETGLKIRILSGDEEAYYDYLGVVNSVGLGDFTLVDIGGGSAEIVQVVGRSPANRCSLLLGAITLTNRFLDRDKIGADQRCRLEKHLNEAYAGIPWLGGPGTGPALVGLGGTVRTIAKIYRNLSDYPLDLLHGMAIPMTAVEAIYRDLAGMSLSQRKEVAGLSSARADIIVAGVAVVCAMARVLGAQELIISGRGLRDGLFFDDVLDMERSGGRVDDPAMFAVRNLMRYHRIEEPHAQHVADLAASLFDQLSDVHRLGGGERRLFYMAALLHDIGITVSYYNHGAHGLYLLTRAGIDGLSHRELVKVAYVVAIHSANAPGIGRWPAYRALLSDDDEETVGKLGVLLRLAEAFDRSESGSVRRLTCRIDGREKVTIAAESLPTGEFDIRQAIGVSSDFEKAFGVPLTIVADPISA